MLRRQQLSVLFVLRSSLKTKLECRLPLLSRHYAKKINNRCCDGFVFGCVQAREKNVVFSKNCIPSVVTELPLILHHCSLSLLK
jgi:hypothetical protein